MTKKPDVTVKVSRQFEYDLDESRRRTLPVGWTGPVPAAIARKIKSAGAGIVVEDIAKRPASDKLASPTAGDHSEDQTSDDGHSLDGVSGDETDNTNPDV